MIVRERVSDKTMPKVRIALMVKYVLPCGWKPLGNPVDVFARCEGLRHFLLWIFKPRGFSRSMFSILCMKGKVINVG